MSTDPLIDVLSAVVTVLDRGGVLYAVTGSVASSILGEPRTSLDIDIVVQMSTAQARQIVRSLPPRFYCSERMLVDAVTDHSIANLIDQETGLKVDLSVMADAPFFKDVMKRRILLSFGPDTPGYYVVTAEDVILMKLLWRLDSQSKKQWDDALGVVRVRGALLDWKYLFEQAGRLDITEDLEALRDEGGV